MHGRPQVILIGGPNGAGKTTSAKFILHDFLGVDQFVNADLIAQGLSGFGSDRVALQAGKVMLRRLHELANSQSSFAFETTLASRSFAPWLRELKSNGYQFTLIYIGLSTPELSISRVAERVRVGGHHVPSDIIKRRYSAGLRNFFQLYLPIADRWRFYDNSGVAPYRMIAGDSEIIDPRMWEEIRRRYDDSRS